MPEPAPQLASVQALRALAALAVAVVHFEMLIYMLIGPQNKTPVLLNLGAGVDLFFVISGFVMVYSTWHVFGQAGAPVAFLTSRIIRIVPLYWLTMSLAISLGKSPTWGEFAGSFLFIPYRSAGGEITPLYGVGWTLNFEMFFYALFACALLLPRRAALIALLIVLCTLVVLGLAMKPSVPALILWTDPMLLEFAAGMLLATAYLNGARIPTWAGVVLVVLSVGLVAAFRTSMPPTGPRVFTCGAAAVCMVAGVVLGLGEPRPGALLTRALVMLGNASYALYMTHTLVIVALYRLWAKQMIPIRMLPAWAVAAIGCACAVGLSVIVYRTIERPLTLRLKRSLLGARPRPLPRMGTTTTEASRWSG